MEGTWIVFKSISVIWKIALIIAIGLSILALIYLYKLQKLVRKKIKTQWRLRRIKGDLKISDIRILEEKEIKDSDDILDDSGEFIKYRLSFYGFKIRLDLLVTFLLLASFTYLADPSIRSLFKASVMVTAFILFVILWIDYMTQIHAKKPNSKESGESKQEV